MQPNDKKYSQGSRNNFRNAENTEKSAFKLAVAYVPGSAFYNFFTSKGQKIVYYYSFNTGTRDSQLNRLICIVDKRKQFIQTAILYDNQTKKEIKRLT